MTSAAFEMGRRLGWFFDGLTLKELENSSNQFGDMRVAGVCRTHAKRIRLYILFLRRGPLALQDCCSIGPSLHFGTEHSLRV